MWKEQKKKNSSNNNQTTKVKEKLGIPSSVRGAMYEDDEEISWQMNFS